ncbi:hypothetical protein NUM3379_34860 [Kineococcus sp. NUM-3379]
MSRSRPRPISQDVQLSVVLAVLAGELSMSEAARRHGVAAATVGNWRDRFLAAGKEGLVPKLPGTPGVGTSTERRLRAENEQLKLALAEAIIQVRILQMATRHTDAAGAAAVNQVPSGTSRP